MSRRQHSTYVPLRVRSQSTLLKGGSTVGQLFEEAASHGYTGLALTDENNLYASWELFDTAKAYGMQPILGAILFDNEHSLIALVETQTGYSNLCKLITRKHLAEDFTLLTALQECHEGLVFVVRNPFFAKRLTKILDYGTIWLECCRPMPQSYEKALWDIARASKLPVVATTDVFYAHKDDQGTHKLLTAVRNNCHIRDVPELPSTGCYHLPSPDVIKATFSDCPEAVTETRVIAERCQFRFAEQLRHFPTIPSAGEELNHRVRDGIIKRFGKSSPKIESRVNKELTLLVEMGFADYFLVVADIVNYARSIGTPVAGRGSGANSLVAYCLGITNVDPLHYNLPFARFLNRGRKDFPDLDLDFCWQKRDDIINYVFKTYGHKHVAMISTMNTMKPRASFRLTAKAFGYSQNIITHMQRVLSTVSLEDLDNPKHPCWQAIGLPQEGVANLINQSSLLSDRPHHVSLHPGGILISPDPITNHTPLQRSAKGIPITQFDKDGIKRLGLVKIDLLGNRSVSAAGEAIRLVQKRYRSSLDIEALIEEDAATAELLRKGDTLGVGQLESPLMRQLLKQLRVSSPKMIMQTLALVRPGPASLQLKEVYLRRARGLDQPTASYGHEVLTDTYGLLLFEDDALKLICALTGLDPVDADRLRKQLGRCANDDEREQMYNTFLTLCKDNQADLEKASRLWVQMSMFNGYSFCRGHAASYAKLAWFNAYIKAHYPLQFWVSALNNIEGFYDKWVYVEEAKRQGIRVLKPCINSSQEFCTVEGDSIRLGLSQIRGLTKPTMKTIISARPFLSSEDFRERIKLSKPESRALNLCGAIPDKVSLSPQPSYPEQFRNTWEILGVSVREHPTHHFRQLLRSKGFSLSRELPHVIGNPVKLCGIPATSRSVRGRDGKDICFFTLSDEAGTFEVTLPSDVYERRKLAIAQSNRSVFCVSGVPEIHYDSITIRAKDIQPLNEMLSALLRIEALGVG